MSSPSSAITKVIFAQKIFRFAGRTVKDLVIINSVCKDFEETMQAHHTFNLVLYDNIIKTRFDENDFLEQSVGFLETSSAWIVYQWTTVNEHDETQRQLLKALLLYQAENDNKIFIRDLDLLDNKEDSSTTRELFCHILDSCIQLGIVKDVLGASENPWNCIMQAVSRKITADCLKVLIESCVQHGLDVKRMLEQRSGADFNCIIFAVSCQLPFDSFKVLLDSCVQHSVDVKKMLKKNGSLDWNCIWLAVQNQLSVDSFQLLIESCVQHGIDVKQLLEEKDSDDRSCVMLAAASQLPFDSFKLLIESCVQQGVDMKKMLEQLDSNCWSVLSLTAWYQLHIDSFRLLIAHFPSNESFRTTLAVANKQQKRAIDSAREEIKTLLEDPNCWQKCHEWRKQQQEVL